METPELREREKKKKLSNATERFLRSDEVLFIHIGIDDCKRLTQRLVGHVTSSLQVKTEHQVGAEDYFAKKR